MATDRTWEYRGYECRTWITDDGNIKFSGVREDGQTDRKTGLLLSPDKEKSKEKIESGVEELETRIDEDLCRN